MYQTALTDQEAALTSGPGHSIAPGAKRFTGQVPLSSMNKNEQNKIDRLKSAIATMQQEITSLADETREIKKRQKKMRKRRARLLKVRGELAILQNKAANVASDSPTQSVTKTATNNNLNNKIVTKLEEEPTLKHQSTQQIQRVTTSSTTEKSNLMAKRLNPSSLVNPATDPNFHSIEVDYYPDSFALSSEL
jgi:hypothetical protein